MNHDVGKLFRGSYWRGNKDRNRAWEEVIYIYICINVYTYM
jgi:hypothetical protein